MITASEFLKWLSVFNVQYGGGVVTIPVSMGQGGTGAALVPSDGSLFYSTATEGALLPTAPDGVLVTDALGIPSISSTLPAGLAVPGYLPTAGGTMTGDLILAGPPPTGNSAANKAYVDAFISGLTFKPPVYAASTANMPATYNNGTAGVGATLTNSGPFAVFETDGVIVPLGQRVEMKNQTNPAHNGIYTVTVEGDNVSVAWVLTRATDYDEPSDIQQGNLFIVNNGNNLQGSGWVQTEVVTTIGTDPIEFSAFPSGASAGGFNTATVSGTAQVASVNTMYILLNAAQTTVTLPAVFDVGNKVMLVGSAANTGGWKLTAAAGDTIMYQGVATTAGGTITSPAGAGLAVEVVADVANGSWVVVDTSSPILTTS